MNNPPWESYKRKCEKISQHYIALGVTWATLAKSIEQHGLTPEIKKYIRDKIDEVLNDAHA